METSEISPTAALESKVLSGGRTVIVTPLATGAPVWDAESGLDLLGCVKIPSRKLM